MSQRKDSPILAIFQRPFQIVPIITVGLAIQEFHSVKAEKRALNRLDGYANTNASNSRYLNRVSSASIEFHPVVKRMAGCSRPIPSSMLRIPGDLHLHLASEIVIDWGCWASPAFAISPFLKSLALRLGGFTRSN